MDAVMDFEQILAQAGITPDKPLYATLLTVHNETLALDAKVDALQDRPPADIERAVRTSLVGLRPAFEVHWRWQHWIGASVAFAVGMVTMSMICAASWSLATSVARHDASVEIVRWQTWWRSACGDTSPNRVVLNGKPICQVPIERMGN
jgi:hypothetical protein